MGHIVFVLVALILLAGFLGLTAFEERRGIRLFAEKRSKFDARIARMEFILENVDLWSFTKEEMLRLGHRLGHDFARLTLDLVRAIERLLTRLVRRLRPHRPLEETGGEVRPFVKTLSDFKDRLKQAAEEGSETGALDETTRGEGE
ncbi:MAG TPA: hypothetical protein VFP46_00025 [Candidatus Paceibacterota bacterium]|nr:hypothetical protein [Candidatus Paceibacterota bacterium]